ncbi:hypothetical protein KQI84_10580 [bacterium]|nr:hypothetical protein [bacterium]
MDGEPQKTTKLWPSNVVGALIFMGGAAAALFLPMIAFRLIFKYSLAPAYEGIGAEMPLITALAYLSTRGAFVELSLILFVISTICYAFARFPWQRRVLRWGWILLDTVSFVFLTTGIAGAYFVLNILQERLASGGP